MTLATSKIRDRQYWDDGGNERWPGIVSRFQLVILAGQRSRQLFNGALSRIPADPMKKRNTSIALEELRRGLVPFRGQNSIDIQNVLASLDPVVKTTAEHGAELDLPKAE